MYLLSKHVKATNFHGCRKGARFVQGGIYVCLVFKAKLLPHHPPSPPPCWISFTLKKSHLITTTSGVKNETTSGSKEHFCPSFECHVVCCQKINLHVHILYWQNIRLLHQTRRETTSLIQQRPHLPHYMYSRYKTKQKITGTYLSMFLAVSYPPWITWEEHP